VVPAAGVGWRRSALRRPAGSTGDACAQRTTGWRWTTSSSIAPSILAADFARLGEEVADVAPAVPTIHVDVMDGHYVPNITLGHPVVKSLRAATDRVLDCHLMITDPATYAPQLVALGAESVTFHPEVEDDPIGRSVHELHETGRAGRCRRSTRRRPLSTVEELLPARRHAAGDDRRARVRGSVVPCPAWSRRSLEAAAWRQANHGTVPHPGGRGDRGSTPSPRRRALARTSFVAGSAVFGARRPPRGRRTPAHDLLAAAAPGATSAR
jgi:ribulose-phosphate 3-epimerase